MINREDNLKSLLSASLEQLKSETDEVANLANISAYIMEFMDDINWAGFYLLKGDDLVLGPFQGKPACIRIPWGMGVCGAAINEERVMRVDDVHSFPGHIACDAASNSEIVLPLYKRDMVYGVLDIDSPSFARFTELEETYLTELAEKISKYF